MTITQAQLDDMILRENTYMTIEGDTLIFRCTIQLKLGATVSDVTCVSGPLMDDERDAHLGNIRARAMRQVKAIAQYAQAQGVAPSTAKERAEVELTELRAKVRGLNAWLSKSRPVTISEIEWELQHEQRTHMIGYMEVLETRLENWE